MPILSNISLFRNRIHRILPYFSHRVLHSLAKTKTEVTDYSSTVNALAERWPDKVDGIVSSAHSNLSRVVVESVGPMIGLELLCVKRGIVTRPIVGDYVKVDNVDWVERRGRIVSVFKRFSEISVPPVANVNHLLLFFSIDKPVLEPYSLTKFLIDAESTGIPFTLAVSKTELVDEDTVNTLKSRINEWGYDPVFCSVATRLGLDTLLSRLKDKITVVLGPSGCGKSSLINALRTNINQNRIVTEENQTSLIVHPSVEENLSLFNSSTQKKTWFKKQRVGEVSAKIGQGKHTTSSVSLHALPEGGYVVDTPGFNLPKLKHIKHDDLEEYFPEIRRILRKKRCLLSDCYHIGEPGCIVIGYWERYLYYLRMLDEIVNRDGLVVGIKIHAREFYKTLFVRGDPNINWKENRNLKENPEVKKNRLLGKKKKTMSIFDDIEDFIQRR